ncbi:serine hydrolase [Lewinella sp. 4G2]|uniref:serine hydrolase domain-containing protein n=1 Tax=Lewinella sp. 4G2 TaxID=1803372 RepID=UPI0007B4AC82|nr:serine hydrolase domain-containing protein [Lewinella sp. 4G2]OAV45153.1 hypothetical protein A3850_011915 [Lewinella sp. 4G2]
MQTTKNTTATLLQCQLDHDQNSVGGASGSRPHLLTQFSLVATLFLLFFLVGVSLEAQTPLDRQDELVAKADAIIAQSVEARDFAGLSAGIFIDDKIRWAGGGGYLNVAERTPATKDMLHRIASISKPMTAVAILQLARAGKLDLGASIDTYLPDSKIRSKDKITVRQLLNHTSGIKAYASEKEFVNFVEYPNSAAAMDIFQTRKLRFKPGKGFQYTTYGYTVLGAIIEAVTGDSYAAYMRKNVWEPAGMINTDIEVAGKSYPNKSSLYGMTATGDFQDDPQDNLSNKYAGGGIHSTAEDLLRFGQAILDNELLTEAELKSMRKYPDIARHDTPYGLGWYVHESADFGRVVRHGGAQSGTSTYLTIYLDARVVVAIIGNTSGADMEIGGLRYQLGRTALSPETLNEPLRPITQLSTAQLQQFTGTYAYPDGGVSSIVLRGSQLYGEAKGAPTIKLYPASETAIFARVYPIEFNFEKETDGSLRVIDRVMNGERVLCERK